MASSLTAFSAGAAAQTATQAVRGIARQLVFHLKDYGPTGTADDSGTFNAAIAAAQSVNGVVYVPAGIYTCGPLVTGVAPFTMQGESMYTTVIKLKNASNGWLMSLGTGAVPSNSILFLNICLDGNNPNQSTGGGCLNALYAVHCNFIACRFTQGTDAAVWLQGGTGGGFGHNNSFLSCLIDNGRNNAVQTMNGLGVRTNSNDENFFMACDFTFNGTTGGTQNYAVWDASGTNYWTACNFVGGANGFRLNSAPNPRLTGCHWDGVGGDAINLQGTGAVISGCTFSRPGSITANTFSAVRVANAGGGHTVVGNQMTTDKLASGFITHSFYREGGAGIPSTVCNNTLIAGPTNAAYTAFGTAAIIDGNIGTRYDGNTGWPDSPQIIRTTTKTAAYTLTVQDQFVAIGANNVVLTLPSAAVRTTRITVKNTGNYTGCTLNVAGSDHIDNAVSYAVPATLGSVDVQGDGVANWWIV